MKDAKWNKIYHSWRCLIDRCRNETHKQFKNYGGRGIRVCERWLESGKIKTRRTDMKTKLIVAALLIALSLAGIYKYGNAFQQIPSPDSIVQVSTPAAEQLQTEESKELCCEETEGMTDDDTEGAKNDGAEEEDTNAEFSDDYVILRSCKIIMSYLKDPYSFQLLKFKVSDEKYRDASREWQKSTVREGVWKVVTIEYTATNSYGGRVRSSAMLEFDPQGNARFVY